MSKYGDTSTPNRQNRSSTYTEVNPGPYIGIVKDNVDPGKMGGLRVLIPSLAGVNEGYAGQLYDVQYLMPFYGSKSVQALGGSDETQDISKYEDGGHSYGMWMVPPDIDSRVMVIFVEGKVSQGFWFGCVQEPLTNHMIPGIAASKDTVGLTSSEDTTQDLKREIYGTDIVPAAEVNRKMFKKANKDGNIDKLRKAIHPFANTLREQGLSQDTVRGTTSSSARRESPSAVFGISTPGRTDPAGYKAKLGPLDAQEDVPVVRSAGHTFVMDDGDAQGDNQLIRLRTSSGHQLLMHDTSGVMYLANAKGTVWMEFSGDGAVDIYAQKGYNIRSGGDINFHSEGDINMYANRNIKIKANEHLGEDPMDRTIKGIVSIDGSIINQIANRAMNVSVDKGYYSLRTGMSIYTQAAGGNQIHQAAGQVHLVGSQVHFNSMPVDPNLLQPLQRTGFGQPNGTGTAEVQVPDVTPILKGSVGVLRQDRSIPGMSGMRVPTHEPFLWHYDNFKAFTSSGKREDANKPGTLGYQENQMRKSLVDACRLGQYQADLEKYVGEVCPSKTDVAALQKAAAEFTQNYSTIFNLTDSGPLAIRPLLPGISDVSNQIINRITGAPGGELGNLFKDQVFVGQAGVLYTLGDMGKVITNLSQTNPQGIVKQLTATAANSLKTTVGDALNNAVKSQVKDVASSIFSDRNTSAIKDFFRNDGIDTYALANDMQQIFSSESFKGLGGLGDLNIADAFKGLGGLGDLESNLSISSELNSLRQFEALGFDVDWASLPSASSFVDPQIFSGGGLQDLFKNADNIFGPALGAFGNNVLSGINLANLSPQGILQGLGNAAIQTGISIVTDQFRNIIAGEITSLTNITSVLSGGIEGIFGSAGTILGEIGTSVADVLGGFDNIASIANFDLSSLVGDVGASISSFFG
jgi:hypothetical protein